MLTCENFQAKVHQEESGLRVTYTENREVLKTFHHGITDESSITEEIKAKLAGLCEASRQKPIPLS
jgi:hypothetical protein